MTDTASTIEMHLRNALAGLKDFQAATVDVVHRRLFGDNQKSLLVADEVGLGKTIVAKGVIAKEVMARIQSGQKGPLKVTYICSNQVIAGENVRKLNLFPEQDVIDSHARRIAYLAYEFETSDAPFRKNLTLNSLTPITSFRGADSCGTKYERAIIYALLCADPRFSEKKNGLSCLLRGPVRMDIDEWRGWLEYQKQYSLRPDLPHRFLRLISTRKVNRSFRKIFDLLEHQGIITVEDATFAFAELLRANNEQNHRGACLELIRVLRQLLIDACLEYVDADLYILDEFQRFRNLINPDSEDDEAVTARRIFGQKRARILLLSATPFKAYTGEADHANGEDHFRDFRVVLRFLLDNDELIRQYDGHRSALYRQLLQLDNEQLDLSPEHKIGVENILRTIMCRTERNSVASDPGAMIKDCWHDQPVPFSKEDITNFVVTDQVSEALARIYEDGRHTVCNPIEYCKSAPYPLSYLDGYILKRLLSHYRRDSQMRKVLKGNRNAWLDMQQVNTYQLTVGPSGICSHARLAQLIDHSVGTKGAALLWVPPSLPYYPLEGLYAGTDGFTKTLIFSSWVMVPRMIASLVSYEVERRTVGNPVTRDIRVETEMRTYFAPTDKKSYRRHPVPQLIFRVEDQDNKVVQNMSNFCLLYPSPFIARIISHRELMMPECKLNALRNQLAKRIALAIDSAKLSRYERSTGASDKWYWAAALLLDKADATSDLSVRAWINDDKLNESSNYFTAKGTDTTAKTQHFAELVEAYNYPEKIGLGKIPSDLAEVLAEMALGSPAVVAARSLAKLFSDSGTISNHDLGDAFKIAVEFLNLFNKPESISAIRLGSTTGHFWRQALRYGADSCLQAVMDEYLHLLKGQSGERKTSVNDLTGTINLNVASINVDGLPSFFRGRPQKMRCHYAVEFGNQKIETEEGQQRASSIRANFNSPFRPFVLATTSIGQEGLDFHQYCRRIVHWNLPGNPIDLEQREGRINRYKGLVVRQQLAQRYNMDVRQSYEGGDIWDAIFKVADQRERIEKEKSELVPYWLVDTNEIQIERYVPIYPYSQDGAKLARILKTLAIYRLAFGQPRQVELIDQLLSKKFTPDQVKQICQELMVNLSPLSYANSNMHHSKTQEFVEQ